MTVLFTKNFQRGFGTYPLKGDDLVKAIRNAIDCGYRAFDTAQMYGNEADTGKALHECGIPGDQLCITTKVHPDNFSADRFISSVENSLRNLRVEAVDVLLLHWPPADGEIGLPLELLQQAHDRGLAKNIGVSNFNLAMLETAVGALHTMPCTNQVEFHPLLDQRKLLEGASAVGVPLSSYCSIARGEVFKHPLFEEIGSRSGKNSAQVALRWIVQKGVSLNTMSTKPDNMQANYDIMDFTLSNVDMARIDKLNATGYRIVHQGLVPWAPEWD